MTHARTPPGKPAISLLTPPTKDEDNVEWGGNDDDDDDIHEAEGAWELPGRQ